MESRQEEGASKAGRRVRIALLVVLLAPLLVLKLAYDPTVVGHNREDSTLFYLVARSVANGQGLRTPVSLYHQGLRDLPAPSPIYPLWPLVLGVTGRLIGLERATALLPEALYFVALLLAYVLGNLLAEELRRRAGIVRRRLLWVDLGHLAVLLLGANLVFFWSSSYCLTEALSMSLLLAAMLALQRAPARPLFAALAGALGGLAYLTRSQMVLVPIAIPLALVLAGRQRRERLRPAAFAAAGALLAVIPWVAYLIWLPGSFHPRMLVDFTAFRQTPALPRFSGFVEFDSIGSRLADAATGLGVAFDPRNPRSYLRSFGYAVYLVPLALSVWCLSARKAVRSAPAGDASPLAWGMALTSLASLLPLHLMHGVFPAEWFFCTRHGLPMMMAILLAAGTLLVRRLPLRLAALGLAASALVASVLWPANASGILRGNPDEQGGQIWPVERDLVAWLDARERPALAVSTRCRELALWSSATFHWIRRDSSPEETRSLFENLPIDYLLVYSDEEECSFHRGLERELELVQSFGQKGRSIQVYRWRRS